MKIDFDNLSGYTGWALERLKAQGRQLKEAAEKSTRQSVKAIWAVGSIAGDGEFDETSDIELLFELYDMSIEIDDYDLQLAIEQIETEVGFIQCYVDSPEPSEQKILIIN
jgi:predicted nucleotidyltransferase